MARTFSYIMSPLLKTTNASFSFVIVHVGATLHAQEITFSWKSVQPNNRPIRDDRYLNNGFTVNPTRAKTCCREGMKGRSKRNGEFSLTYAGCLYRYPSPLRNMIFNCIRPSRITAPFYSYNLSRVGRGEDAFDYRTSTGVGERRAPHNTDIYPRAS